MIFIVGLTVSLPNKGFKMVSQLYRFLHFLSFIFNPWGEDDKKHGAISHLKDEVPLVVNCMVNIKRYSMVALMSHMQEKTEKRRLS